MPIAIDATAVSAAVPPAAAATAEPAAPGFAEALAAQSSQQAQAPAAAPTSSQGLPTVALGTMLSAFAGAPMDISELGAGPSAPALGELGAAGPTGGPTTATGAGAAILQAGERYLGVPYLWGGTDPATGLDCSGFVQQVFGDLGTSLPRVSADQSRSGVEVPGGLAAAQPGDLLFWRGTGGRPNHIGIYAGGGQMLDAPRSGEVVGYRDITRGEPDAVRRVNLPG